jgi:DNA-binding response OmpR family regulator
MTNERLIDRPPEIAIRFDQFHVLPHSRQLLANNRSVEIGSRAFDLLLALLEASGELVTKDELVARAWPNTVVSESNLRVQIAALRNALGPAKGIIRSISGRGYVLTASILSSEQLINAAAVKSCDVTTMVESSRLLSTSSTQLRPESRPTVAVIDDDAELRESLRELLRSVDLHAQVFSSTREFLQSSAATGCRCLILDVKLPGRSGLDFYDDLISAHVRLPVIFISGYADAAVSTRAMNLGAVEYLIKPLRREDLLHALQFAINNNDARQSCSWRNP